MVALHLLALVVMVIGLVGVVVPVLPGLLLVWLAGVGTLLLVDTDATGWTVAAVLTVLFVLGTAATIYLPTRTGRRGDVPGSSLLAAGVGAVVGFVVLPVVGFLVGAFLGLLAAEQRRQGDTQAAWRTSIGVARAYGVGVLVELVLGVTMIGIWAVTVLVRGVG
jgi:uncharacterized protein YqgC (DUF456 family)